jgi:hypothetical protein
MQAFFHRFKSLTVSKLLILKRHKCRARAPARALTLRGESPRQAEVSPVCDRRLLRRGDTGWGAAGGELPVRNPVRERMNNVNSIRPAEGTSLRALCEVRPVAHASAQEVLRPNGEGDRDCERVLKETVNENKAAPPSEGGWRQNGRKRKRDKQGDLPLPVFNAARWEQPAGRSQSVRSSEEASNDRGAKGTQEGGRMNDRTTEDKPTRVPARANRWWNQPSAIDLAGPNVWPTPLETARRARSSSPETPLTGKPDAGNPPVRFGGRGEVNPSSLPLSFAPKKARFE